MSSDAITLIAITTVGWQEGVGTGEEDWEWGRNEEKAMQGAGWPRLARKEGVYSHENLPRHSSRRLLNMVTVMHL